MSEHKAVIKWMLSGEDFKKGRYSRVHSWSFDGGATFTASASPAVVPLPFSSPDHVDPEEAFVASIASCHMLTFLHLASRQGLEITSYEDEAVGVMSKNEEGSSWISAVTLRPKIRYRVAPSPVEERRLHTAAHHGCFISNSVKTAVTVAATA